MRAEDMFQGKRDHAVLVRMEAGRKALQVHHAQKEGQYQQASERDPETAETWKGTCDRIQNCKTNNDRIDPEQDGIKINIRLVRMENTDQDRCQNRGDRHKHLRCAPLSLPEMFPQFREKSTRISMPGLIQLIPVLCHDQP